MLRPFSAAQTSRCAPRVRPRLRTSTWSNAIVRARPSDRSHPFERARARQGQVVRVRTARSAVAPSPLGSDWTHVEAKERMLRADPHVLGTERPSENVGVLPVEVELVVGVALMDHERPVILSGLSAMVEYELALSVCRDSVERSALRVCATLCRSAGLQPRRRTSSGVVKEAAHPAHKKTSRCCSRLQRRLWLGGCSGPVQS